MGGGGKGGGSGDNEVRFAPYLEDAHQYYLNAFKSVFLATKGQSPYGDYEQIEYDPGFFGGAYNISSFPSLWDMFGKFMAGLDVHVLWSQIYSDLVEGPEVANAINAQSALSLDEIDTNVMPKFLAGMRDINHVQGTAFVIGKAIILDGHVKAINKFASQIRIAALTLSSEQWGRHLDWNKTVISTYSEMFKLYYASRIDIDRVNLEYRAKDEMWDINLFDNARAILGALTGSPATTSGNEPSQTQRAIGGAMTGAAAGWMTGGAAGAAIGGLIGLASSFF